MIKYFDGTVFNTNSHAIVNTVNCDGFMGAGLALEFALRYPNMFNNYENKCKNKLIKVGQLDYFQDEKMIINFPTKNSFKFPSHIKWIKEGLEDFCRTYKNYNIQSVAFPKLGCSNGGLEWNEVKLEMENYLLQLDIEVYICLDTLQIAQGTEKTMIDAFNKINLYELSNIVKLTQKQIVSLESKRPYTRFWMISKTDGIGKNTYKNLFKYFYKNQSEQMKLF